MSEQLNDSQHNTTGANRPKMKKFVFQLYGDNVDFIESLPIEEKNRTINMLVQSYKTTHEFAVQDKKLRKSIKKAVFLVLLLLVGTPMLIKIVNFSIVATLNSYGEMQMNFEKLFDSRP
ncbi:MAG: hypothetical protein GX568_01340 [Candidatus Gastranaerophilales bacterium]|nr:hypothetical protein [Candidatus Gastranaerophilales bacterium]